MGTITSIDLWTEQYPKGHELECIKGAFIDGVSIKEIICDNLIIVKDCNCEITNNIKLNISNKHNAVIFYKNLQPLRLLVFNYKGNLNNLLDEILTQKVEGYTLKEIFKKFNVKTRIEQQNNISNQSILEEIDVGSCDNPELLKSMLGDNILLMTLAMEMTLIRVLYIMKKLKLSIF